MTIKERVTKNIEFMKQKVGDGFGIYVVTCNHKDKDLAFVVPMELSGKTRQEGMNKEILILKIFAKSISYKKLIDKDLKVELIMSMSEAWTVIRSKEQGWDGVMPSQCDDKKEVVMCSGMDIDGNQSFVSYEIKSQPMDGVIVKSLATEPLMEYHSVDGKENIQGMASYQSPVFDEFFKAYKNAT